MKITDVAVDIYQAFKEKSVFEILKAVGFKIEKLFKAVLKFTNLIRQGLTKVFEEIHKLGIIQLLQKGVMKVDDFLNRYPLLKKVVGPALVGLLLFMWLNMTFIGDLDYDFNFDDIVGALNGNFTLVDLFISPKGLMLITLFLTGLLSGGAISIPWLVHSHYNLALAFVYTGLRRVKTGSKVISIIKGLIKTGKNK